MIGQGVRRFRFFLFGHPVRCFASSSPAPDRASIVWRDQSQYGGGQSEGGPESLEKLPCLSVRYGGVQNASGAGARKPDEVGGRCCELGRRPQLMLADGAGEALTFA